MARVMENEGRPQTIATVDQDATIIESHKEADYPHYEGGCGYQLMVSGLAEALAEITDVEWKTLGRDPDGTARQWADVDYLPSAPYEGKEEKVPPLRYVGLRLLKPQGQLFADGSDRLHFAVITNLECSGDRLLPWHREKAGTIEHVQKIWAVFKFPTQAKVLTQAYPAEENRPHGRRAVVPPRYS